MALRYTLFRTNSAKNSGIWPASLRTDGLRCGIDAPRLSLLGELEPRLAIARLCVWCFSRGKYFPVKQLRRIAGLWPSPDYYNLYGPTETNVCTFSKIPTPVPGDQPSPIRLAGPVRTARRWGSMKVLPYNLVRKGCSTSRGQLFSRVTGGEPETAASFIECDGVRWYNTGDVVKQQGGEGFLYVGRRDRMIKRRGYRIELGEVESCHIVIPRLSEQRPLPFLIPRPDEDYRVFGCSRRSRLAPRLWN